jgi:4-amino-4-deoxy-L-arabinose transferase-like glycosyltransferase
MRIKAIFWIILLLLSLKIGADLRLPGYNVIPDPYIILDEHTNVWHGLSLRKTGIPTAWSQLDAYVTDSKTIGAGGSLDGFNLSVDNVKPTFKNFSSFPKPVVGLTEMDYGRGIYNTPLVQPYLDHPPFGAFILSLSVSKNAKTLEDVNNFDLRQSAIRIAVLTQLLIFVLVFLITKKPLIGIIASSVYATVPSYLLLSRYALLENIMSPLILAGIIFLILAKNRLEKKKMDRLLGIMILLAGITGGLVALTKLTGWIFILGSIILLYLWKFKFKQILVYTIPAFLIGILYFVWGFYLSPKLFTDLLLLQTGRDFIGSINLLVTFFRVSIYNFPLDGWWIGGFIALFTIPRKKEYLPIVVMAIGSLFSALAVSGANYPWYFIPLIPFMAIAIAIFLYKLATNPSLLSILFTFFVFISSSLYWGYGVFQKIQPFMLYRLVFLVFIGIGAFWEMGLKKEKYKKLWYFGVIVLLMILAILNRRSIFFILEHWGKLPLIYTPGTF